MSDALSAERLDEIRERVDLAAWGAAVDGRPTPDDVALLAHVDYLTAELARARAFAGLLNPPNRRTEP